MSDRVDEKNRDPLTNEPGSHPASTGAGAVTGGLIGGVAGAAIGGPVGAAVGISLGAVAGGLGGRELARQIDLQAEEDYWRAHHHEQDFAGAESYEEYAHAYRVGCRGYGRNAAGGKTFTDVESDLEADYGAHSAGLPWNKARHASQAAWERLHRQSASDSPPGAPERGISEPTDQSRTLPPARSEG